MKYPPQPHRRLAVFTDLYRQNLARAAELHDRFDRALAQYRGSDRIDRSAERAVAVRNITFELVESQVSCELPMPRVEPEKPDRIHRELARSIERLCIRVRDRIPFEKWNDLDERATYIYGGSVWLVEWETDDRNGEGGIRIRCVDPRDFIPQAGVEEVEDMEYLFLRFRLPKEEAARRYALSAAAAEGLEEGETEGTVQVVCCYFRREDGHIGRFVFSGEQVLEDEPDYFARHGAAEETLERDIPLSDGRVLPALSPCREGGVMHLCPTRLPYYLPRRFPVVVRRSVSEAGSLFGLSDCDIIRPQQQQINKLESRILQKLVRAGVTPMLPEDAEICPDNSLFGQVIRLKMGEDRGQYGVLDTTPAIAQDVSQSDRIYDHAKRILGITDSYLGIGDKTALSGVAKQVQVEQAAGRLLSKRRMKQAAYSELDRLIFEYHLAYADRALPYTYTDASGEERSGAFSRYDFYFFDPETQVWRLDDGFLFSADQNGAPEQQREAMWQKNLENLKQGTLGDPADPAVLLHYWQCQERVHYPHARENVEFFRKKIRDSVIEQESAQAEAALPDTAAFEAANPPFGGGIG